MPLVRTLASAAIRTLPAELAARLDLLRPSCWTSWGGPLNGQARRRHIVREIARAIPFDRVVETGTYRGTSTEFFAAVFGVPVVTVECNARFFAFSRRRLSVLPEVSVTRDESTAFLRALADGVSGETVFVYLDAHWKEHQPLPAELRLVASGWERCVVMADDFEVPGDEGYGYADYGPESALTEAALPEDALRGWALLYPASSSNEETGARRGCCVLASPAVAEQAQVPSLRFGRVI